MSLEEQFAQLESTPTKSSGVIGSYQVQSSQTQGIIDSILGEKAEVNEQQVSQAIGTLSTGDFGRLHNLWQNNYLLHTNMQKV